VNLQRINELITYVKIEEYFSIDEIALLKELGNEIIGLFADLITKKKEVV
jgi:hypothetical protein